MKTIVKKALAVIMCIAVTFCAAPASGVAQLAIEASALGGNQSQAVTYSFDYLNGTLTIKGTGVASDDSWSAYQASRTKKIVINEGITGIGASLFSTKEYPILESVSIAKTVKSIGESAFEGCTMQTVSFPNGTGLTEIGERAFSNCGFTSFSIPYGIKKIGKAAFFSCTALTSVTIPATVTEIGDNAFAGCTSLKNITIGENVTSIGQDAFYYTGYAFQKSNYESGVLYLGKYVLGYAEMDTVGYDYSAKKCVIKDGTKVIAGNAFSGNTVIEEVVLPKSLTNVGEGAFYNCTKLKTVDLYHTEAEWKTVNIGANNYPLINAAKYYDYNPNGVKSIVVKTYPEKMDYFLYDNLDTTGLTITVNYFTGSPKTVSSGFVCDPEMFETVGQQTVTVYYDGRSTSFEVSVAAKLERIEVANNNPNKPYWEGDSFDKSTVDVTAYYNDGSSRILANNEYTFAPLVFETDGQNTVTISHEGMTGTVNVNVRRLLLDYIQVKSAPDKTEYFDGDTLDTTGLTVTKYYNSGASEVLDDTQVTCAPMQLTGSGRKTVTVTYQGKTDTFEVNVTPVELSSIEIDTLPDKTDYCLYDTLDTTGLKIKLIFNNGDVEVVDDGFECAPVALNEEGNQKITVSYDEKTTEFNVSVVAIIDHIIVFKAPDKVDYFAGEELDTSGLVLHVVYNNNQVETVETGFTCDVSTLDTAGEQTVTVTYEEKTDTFTVNVIPVVVDKIEVINEPAKTEYFVGEELDTTGLSIKATYNNGYVETVSSGFECTPTEFTTAGEHTITVTYEGCTTTFKVNLTAVLTEIRVTTKPEKVTYFEGESLDTAGMVVTAYYNDNTTVDLTEGFTCAPELLETPGTQTVTVTYEGKMATFDVTVIAVVIDRIKVKTAPAKTEYYTGDELDLTGLTLKLTYNNGKEEIVDTGYTCDVKILDTAGEQTVTVTYGDKTDTFNINVTQLEVTSIEVLTAPDKTELFVGETLDTTGLTIRAIYNSGKIETVDSGFECTPTEFTTAGEHTITVTYEGCATTFKVNLTAVLTEIKVTTKPSKVTYFEGESLDTAGMVVTAYYNDNTTVDLTEGFTCAPELLETPGKQTVTVTYEGKTTSFDVTVIAVVIDRIEVKTAPAKTSYFTGDKLDATGLELNVIYNNGKVEIVDAGFTCDLDVLDVAGEQTVTVTYGDKTDTFSINVTQLEVTSIEVLTAPDKTELFVGETLDTTGLTIRAIYNSGKIETVDSGFECTPTEFTTAGEHTITVTYEGCTTTFKVNLTAVLTEIKVTTKPSKVTYFEGESLDTAGMVVTAYYNDNTTVDLTEGFTCAPELLETPGTQTVTVTYEGKTTTFDVTVIAVVIDRIEVKTAPAKTSYFTGDKLDATGLELNVIYNNGKVEIVDAGFTCDLDVLDVAGEQTVTVTYGDKTDTFSINVTQLEVTSIEVLTAPDKTELFVGETLDTTGLTIQATYNSGKIETVDSGFECTPTEFTTAGEHTITVTYEGCTTTFKVNLTAVLTEIKITAKPSKVTYFEGDSLDTAGMVVTAYYNDNTTVDLTEGFTCAPELLETTGTQTVTVTYEGKTATFDVTVIAVVIDRIEVKTAPAKTSYFTGDKLDATGLELNVIYNNGKVEIVDAGFTCDLDVLDVAGEQTVTVTYGDKTDTFSINVTQLEVTSIEVLTAPDKTELFVGETLDTTGLTIRAIYNSGKIETVDSGFECTPTEFTSAGEHTITVTYEGCATTFKVNLTAVLTEIKVTTKPSKVTYFEGDSLDTAGMVVTAYYNDNTTVDLTEGFICAPELLETPGTQTVTVTYEGQTATFDVDVIKVVAVNIEIVNNPSKVDYLVGEVLDIAGLTLKVTYNNGDVETVTSGFTCAPVEFTTAGEHTITVTYEDCTTTFKTFSTAVLTGISVKTKPSKLDYFEGEELNTAGMVVTAYYNDNTTVDLTDSFTCAPGLLEKPGKQAVTVTYEGATTTFEVNVIKVVIDRIEIKTQPAKTEYFTGDSLDTTGLTLDVIYNNGNVETVDKGFECDYNIFGTAGRKNVVVTYNEKTTEFSVNVTAVAVERIEIKTLPNKTDYFTGQTLNTTGLTITAFYNNGTVKNFDRGYTCDPKTFSKEGAQTVTVTYEGKTAAFTVNVTREVKRIEIITKPNKTTYFVGDTLDTTGIVIAIIYADGSGSYTSSSFTCDISELNSVGTKTVTVTCKGKTATFTVTVVQKGRIKSVSLEDCVVKHKKEKKLEPNIAVEGSINYTVKFVSLTPSVFEIDDSGNIKTVSKGKGTAICIVTDEYGNVYEARCTVKVKYTFGQILLKIFLPWIKL